MSARTTVTPRSLIQSVGTGQVEVCAHPGTGNSLFLTVLASDGTRVTYEMRWDAIDYMAVVRTVKDHERNNFYYFAVLEAVWRVGEALRLCARDGAFDWQEVGIIEEMMFDKAGFAGSF